MENIDTEEENQEDIEQNIKLEHNIEDDLKIEIANMFGKIFQAHGQSSIPFFNKIYQTHVLPCIQNPTKINLEYALYIIDDAIEFIGKFISEEVLLNMKQVLVSQVTSPQFDLRQSAAYGLGLLA